MSPRSLITVVLAGSCSLLTGCAILGGSGHAGGHATLTQAAEAAKPDSTGKHRRLDVGDTVPRETETGVEVEITESRSEPGATLHDTGDLMSGHLMIGLVGGPGAIAGHHYDTFGDLGIEIGRARDRFRADIVLTASPIEFASHTIAGQSFVDELELNFEVDGRYVLTPTHAFFGAYGIAGLRFSTLFWDYARPVPIVEDGVSKEVTSDEIKHWAIFAGTGVAWMQTRHVHAGFQVLGGVRFYAWQTQEGFSNTLFPPAAFVLTRFELAGRF